MSSARWARPIRSSTASCMVWGFTDTREHPRRASTASFSAVMVSGRPASTVYSVQPDRSMCSASSPTATRQSMRALPRHSPTPVCRAGAKGPSSNMSPSTAMLHWLRRSDSTLMAARMDWGLAL